MENSSEIRGSLVGALFLLIYEVLDAEVDWQNVQQIQDHLREGLENLSITKG